MEARDLYPHAVVVSCSLEEFRTLICALNEVCHGVKISDGAFEVRLGMTREQADVMLRRMNEIYQDVPRSTER